MSTLVQVQLNSEHIKLQEGSIPTSNNAKNRRLGGKTVKIAKSKNMLGPKRQHF